MHSISIAVVGIGSLFPGSTENHGFWKNICKGLDLTSEVPVNHWLIDDYYDPDPGKPGKTYCRRGGFLPKVPFDPLEFGIPPTALSQIDTVQLLALLVAKRVLDDMGGTFDRERTSVILGASSSTELNNTMAASLQRPVWVKAMREAGLPEDLVQEICERIEANFNPWTEVTFPGLLGNVVAGRITNRFDFGGTNCIVDAACASSLAALRMAIQELSLGHADLVISGGLDAMNDIATYLCFSKTPALSPSEDCRPFADNADGTLIGEGIGLFALRRLEDAERDGNPVYAVIRGLGASSDGRAKSIYAPRAEGQTKALLRAYEAAGYSPETVELLEAHGTGTLAGDAAEVAGLKSVFAPRTQKTKPWCAIGSVKSQIGHTKMAAGSASLYKIVMALHHKVLPPTIKIKQPNPNLGFEGSPFYLNTQTRPWIRGSAHPRRASASSFGFGGSNYHITVEEYQGKAPRPSLVRHLPCELLLLSAATSDTLLSGLETLITRLQAVDDFLTVAKNSQLTFEHDASYRLGLVAKNAEHAVQQIAQALARIKTDAEQAFHLPEGLSYSHDPSYQGKIAFLFPGQGSQYLDMGAELAMAFSCVREVWDAAADSDEELAQVVFPPPVFTEQDKQRQEAQLRATDRAQPAIGVTSQAYLVLLRQLGVSPDLSAGHSFGELSALYSAGVLSAADFLSVAKHRGVLMAAAAEGASGAMLAVFAPLSSIEAQRKHWGKDVAIANYNAPEQTVLAGPQEQITVLAAHLDKLGLSCKQLPVATAFHTAMVSSAVQLFQEKLQDIAFAAPQIPVYANATVQTYDGDSVATRLQLAQQIIQPVRFVDTLDALYAAGARLFIEVGPGSVLTELTERCLKNRPHLAIALDGRKGDAINRLWQALARLAVAGVHLNFEALWQGYDTATPPPVEHSKVTVMIDGANYAKAYPPDEGHGVLPAANSSETKPMNSHTGHYAKSTKTASDHALSAIDPRLAAIERMQLKSAQTQQVAQQAMADAQRDFLRTTEALLQRLTGASGAAHASAVMSAPESEPLLLPVAPTFKPNVDAAVTKPVPAGVAVTPARPVASSALSQVHLLQIISEATGFPADMLKSDMELEADLGIDSIKRVEIFAALQTARPELPAIDTQEIARLRTIGDIVSHFQEESERYCEPNRPVVQSEPHAISHASSAVLLEIIATATGFPADMLKLDMELEADLGIDSIKRVEIFAALQAARPDFPAIDTQEIASLRTIGDIACRFQGEIVEPVRTLRADPSVSVMVPLPKGLQRLTLNWQEKRAAGFALPSLDQGSIAIIGKAGVLPEALAEELNMRGLNAKTVGRVPADAKNLIILSGLSSLPLDYQQAALAAFTAVRSFANGSQTQGGALVIIQDSGHFGKRGERAWLGGFAGLAKTAALELPLTTVKCLDVETSGTDAPQLAELIANELLRGGAELEVALKANGQRLIPVEATLAVPTTGEFKLPAKPVLIVSGGARGITAACLLALAKNLPGLRVALLGRTQLSPEPEELHSATDETALRQAIVAQAHGSRLSPRELTKQAKAILASREITATLTQLQQLGAEVLYLPCDMTDASAVTMAVTEARTLFGRIDGLIHGAGVLEDKRLADKTPKQFALVFSTKVTGLEHLLAATQRDQLALLLLFTSVAGRYGNIGQCDYAMANETLNKVAQVESARRGNTCLVRALNWGPWEGGMVTPGLANVFKSRGVGLIDVEVGTQAFVDEVLSQPEPEQIDVVLSMDKPLASHNAVRHLDIALDLETKDYQFLCDHCVKGVPVLPMVLVLEWMARALAGWQPGAKLLEIRDAYLVKGVLLGEPVKLQLIGQVEITDEGLIWDMSLANSATGQVHYTAKALLGLVYPISLEALTSKQRKVSWASDKIYGSQALFHGKAFQLITNITACDDSGISGELLAGRCLEWQKMGWCLDVGILDGGLQLAYLWGLETLHSFSLPSRIERLILSDTPVTRGRVLVVLENKAYSPYHSQSDISITSKTGRTLMRLQGVHMIAVNEVHDSKDEPA